MSRDKQELWKILSKVENNIIDDLNLERARFGYKFFYPLLKALKTNTSVKNLNLRNARIEDKDLEAIAEVLKFNNSIINLNLADNFIGVRGVNGVKALSEALKTNISITELNLSYNSMEKGVKALSEGLKINKSIKQLDLCKSSINRKGVAKLSEALKVNTSIKKLYLRDNFISCQGAKALAEALRFNKSITHLDLKYCSISSASLWDSLNNCRKDIYIRGDGFEALFDVIKEHKLIIKVEIDEIMWSETKTNNEFSKLMQKNLSELKQTKESITTLLLLQKSLESKVPKLPKNINKIITGYIFWNKIPDGGLDNIDNLARSITERLCNKL